MTSSFLLRSYIYYLDMIKLENRQCVRPFFLFRKSNWKPSDTFVTCKERRNFWYFFEVALIDVWECWSIFSAHILYPVLYFENFFFKYFNSQGFSHYQYLFLLSSPQYFFNFTLTLVGIYLILVNEWRDFHIWFLGFARDRFLIHHWIINKLPIQILSPATMWM